MSLLFITVFIFSGFANILFSRDFNKENPMHKTASYISVGLSA